MERDRQRAAEFRLLSSSYLVLFVCLCAYAQIKLYGFLFEESPTDTYFAGNAFQEPTSIRRPLL
jgi:hypothetical protein